jgi:hypothetical protein
MMIALVEQCIVPRNYNFTSTANILVLLCSDISKNIETIKKFQQNKRMKATALAVKATMVFKNNRFKQKILDAAKMQTASTRSDGGVGLTRYFSLGSKREVKDKTAAVEEIVGEGEREGEREGEGGGHGEQLSKTGTQPLWYDDMPRDQDRDHHHHHHHHHYEQQQQQQHL